MEKEQQLTNFEKDALKEVGFIAASHAATALSKLVGQTIDVKVPFAAIDSLVEIPKMLGGKEKLATGIHLPIRGDTGGSALLILPQKNALELADLLMKRKPGTAKNLDELDKSALKEVGNILSSHCLTALSDFLGIKLIAQIPELASDMIGAMIDTVLVKFSQRSEQALVISMEFNIKPLKKSFVTYFLLLFNMEAADTVLKLIKAKAK